jgi:hypothetical protein
LDHEDPGPIRAGLILVMACGFLVVQPLVAFLIWNENPAFFSEPSKEYPTAVASDLRTFAVQFFEWG